MRNILLKCNALFIPFTLAALLGVAVVFTIKTYEFYGQSKQNIQIQYHIQTYTRFAEILEINAQSSSITFKTLDRDVLGETYIQALLADDVSIEKQDARTENNIITGFTSHEFLKAGDLKTSDRALISMATDKTGSIYVYHIVLGSPFPIPQNLQ